MGGCNYGNRFYHCNHTWIPAFDRQTRCGLEPNANYFGNACVD